MFCGKCGNQINNNFCGKCGAAARKQPVEAKYNIPDKQKKSPRISGLIIAVFVILVIMGAKGMFSDKPTSGTYHSVPTGNSYNSSTNQSPTPSKNKLDDFPGYKEYSENPRHQLKEGDTLESLSKKNAEFRKRREAEKEFDRVQSKIEEDIKKTKK